VSRYKHETSKSLQVFSRKVFCMFYANNNLGHCYFGKCLRAVFYKLFACNIYRTLNSSFKEKHFANKAERSSELALAPHLLHYGYEKLN